MSGGQSLAVRIAEWVRLAVFLGFWGAATYRFATGAAFTAADTASLLVSIGLLPRAVGRTTTPPG